MSKSNPVLDVLQMQQNAQYQPSEFPSGSDLAGQQRDQIIAPPVEQPDFGPIPPNAFPGPMATTPIEAAMTPYQGAPQQMGGSLPMPQSRGRRIMDNFAGAFAGLEEPNITPYEQNPLTAAIGGIAAGWQRGIEQRDTREKTDMMRAIRNAPSTKAALDSIISGTGTEKLSPGQLTALQLAYGITPEFLGGQDKRQISRAPIDMAREQREHDRQQRGADREIQIAQMRQSDQQLIYKAKMDDRYHAMLANLDRYKTDRMHEAAMASVDVDGEKVQAMHEQMQFENKRLRSAFMQQILQSTGDPTTIRAIVKQYDLQAALDGIDNPDDRAHIEKQFALSKEEKNALEDFTPYQMLKSQADMARNATRTVNKVQYLRDALIKKRGSESELTARDLAVLGTLMTTGGGEDSLTWEARRNASEAWSYINKEIPDAVQSSAFLRLFGIGERATTATPPVGGGGVQHPLEESQAEKDIKKQIFDIGPANGDPEKTKKIQELAGQLEAAKRARGNK